MTPADLTLKYAEYLWSLGNGVTAFACVQQLALLASFKKEEGRNFLGQKSELFPGKRVGSQAAALILLVGLGYLTAAVASGAAEYYLLTLPGVSESVRQVVIGAAIGRCLVIAGISVLTSAVTFAIAKRVADRLEKERAAREQAAPKHPQANQADPEQGAPETARPETDLGERSR